MGEELTMALTYAQFVRALEKDRAKLKSRKAPNGITTCSVCDIPLQESITGNRVVRKNGRVRHVCSDCYFEKWGDEIEKHPIAMPRRRRGA
jgi:hypothetical protein